MLEALLSLCFMALLCLAGIEVFAVGRGVFFHLDALQEREERAAAGLDRIRLDIREAGLGLAEQAALGLISGLAIQDERVILSSVERAAPLNGEAAAGTSFLPLPAAAGFAAGRVVCVSASGRGEIGIVAAVREDGILMAAPLREGYPAAAASLLLVREVELFLDRDARVLRRRINGGSAQPLIEGASGFFCGLDSSSQVLCLELYLDGNKEVPYAAAILPKNVLLAGTAAD